MVISQAAVRASPAASAAAQGNGGTGCLNDRRAARRCTDEGWMLPVMQGSVSGSGVFGTHLTAVVLKEAEERVEMYG